MTFGEAVEALKRGDDVARLGWNGKGMFLFLVGEDTITVINSKPVRPGLMCTTEYKTLPYIAIKTVGGSVVPWLASQTDILSEDWETV